MRSMFFARDHQRFCQSVLKDLQRAFENGVAVTLTVLSSKHSDLAVVADVASDLHVVVEHKAFVVLDGLFGSRHWEMAPEKRKDKVLQCVAQFRAAVDGYVTDYRQLLDC